MDFGLVVPEEAEVGSLCLEGDFSIDSIFSLNFLTSSANWSYFESVQSVFTLVGTEGVEVLVGTETSVFGTYIGLFRIVLPKHDFFWESVVGKQVGWGLNKVQVPKGVSVEEVVFGILIQT